MKTYSIILREGDTFYAFRVYAWTSRAAAMIAKFHVVQGAKGVA